MAGKAPCWVACYARTAWTGTDLITARAAGACSCVGVGDAFPFLRKILRVLGGHFEHQRLAQVAGCVAEPLQTTTAILFWVDVELLAPSHCAPRCCESSDEGVPAKEAEGFRGHHHSFHGRAKQGIARHCGEER